MGNYEECPALTQKRPMMRFREPRDPELAKP
jgi:hypothetical protein